MARVALPESKIRARRRRHRTILAVAAVLLLLLIATATVYLARAPFLRIAHIDVVGTQTIATSTIAAVAETQLEGSYLYFFPKNNIFLYPKSAIEQKIITELPPIKEVQVSAENFTSIKISITERVPKALWCGEQVASSTSCQLLDEDGVVYAAALDTGGGQYQHYFGVLGTTTPRQFVTAPEFRALTALVDTIAQSQQGTPIAGILVDSNNDVHLQFENGFTLLFPLDADGGDVYERFQLALTSDPFKLHPLSDFEYLDLRFGDKLYYKLKTQ